MVLIIGILAAIALPQYKKAVELSRAKAVLPLLRAINDADQRYLLEKGTYGGISFDVLDIDIQAPPGWACQMLTNANATYAMPHCYKGPVDIGISDGYNTRYNGKFFCDADINNTDANALCKSLGGVLDMQLTQKTRYLIN